MHYTGYTYSSLSVSQSITSFTANQVLFIVIIPLRALPQPVLCRAKVGLSCSSVALTMPTPAYIYFAGVTPDLQRHSTQF
jgi:hypothetical protein